MQLDHLKSPFVRLTMVALLLGAASAAATPLTVQPLLSLSGPGLTISEGGIGLDGLGNGTVMLSVDVQGPVQTAVLYWAGRDRPCTIMGGICVPPVPPEDQVLDFDGNLVSGTEVGNESQYPPSNILNIGYRADVTAIVQAKLASDGPGLLTFTLADGDVPDLGTYGLSGAGILVAYTDLTDPTVYTLEVFEGLDVAFGRFDQNPEAKVTQPIVFNHGPSDEDRDVEVVLFAADGSVGRPDRLDITDSFGNVVQLFNQLVGADGDEWDTIIVPYTIPATGDSTTVQFFSEPIGANPDSLIWVLGALRLPEPCAGRIGDFVWHDENQNGLQDPGEPGLPDVTVELFDGVTTVTTMTDGSGFYEFTGLCAGDYTVDVNEATLPVGFAPTDANQGDDTLDSDSVGGLPVDVTLDFDNSVDETIDFGFISGCTGTIGDFVWNDLNQNGLQDPGEPGIPGATVELFDGVMTVTTMTDGTGFYEFAGLCAGDYTVDVDESTLPPNAFPTLPNVPANDAIDSDSVGGLPVNVTLDFDDSMDETIDFGFIFSEPSIDIEKATNGEDADTPTGPFIPVGDPVNWTYEVTNTGNVTLTNVMVTDDQGVTVTCPQDELDPGESMICTAGPLAALAGQYENLSTVTGDPPVGDPVMDEDPSHYFGSDPSIDIEKSTNGVDADDPNAGDAPQIGIGDPVAWSYKVTNTGNTTLTDIVVTDDQGAVVTCPSGNPIPSLAPGAMETCTANGVAEDLANTVFTTVPGLCGGYPQTPLYENKGTATGETVNGDFVDDLDASHYCNPPDPSIDIEKSTNGVDADDPNAGDAPQIGAGDPVAWTYKVTNTGNVTLSNILVTDDQAVVVTCPSGNPIPSLAPGAMETCTANGLAEDLNNTVFTTVPGLCGGFPQTPLYENKGTATGETVTGDFVEDLDASHYCNPLDPSIDIEKSTNGVDADDPNAGDAPQIGAGDPVAWTYKVTNTGNVTLSNILVTDDQGAVVTCPSGNPIPSLAPGAMETCTANGVAEDLANTVFTTVPGLCGGYPQTPLYENKGTATGETSSGDFVEDLDASHYCNPPDPSIDIEKSTNGVDADDPNAGDAPQIGAGDPVAWTYKVTNTGNVPLSNILVTDDQGVVVTCPSGNPIPSLAPGAMETCTANGLAEDLNNTAFTTVPGLCGGYPQTPLYENKGTATGETVTGDFVEDLDASHYCNPPDPSIDIEKSTNGVDADDPNAGDAPQIGAGDPVAWTYKVTNTGNVTLTNILVTDDQGAVVTCPSGNPIPSLAPGAMETCTANGLAEDLNNTAFKTVPGLCGGFPQTPLYENKGTATGETVTGDVVEDLDPSHYCNPPDPSIDIEKSTNGVDADDPNAGDAPQIGAGDPVAWSYKVTNTGNVTLSNILVTDDQGVVVTCPSGNPIPSLAPGAMETCTANGLAEDLNNTAFTTVPGLCGGFPQTPLYENKGTATGETSSGDFVEDRDASHYCNPQEPSIDIEKATNGVDADDPNAGDAPQIGIGGAVTWTYVVTNTGNTTLSNILVTDDQGAVVTCPSGNPIPSLAPGAMETCTANGVAEDLASTEFTTVPGLCGGFPQFPLYENKGTATGETVTGDVVEDLDPSHYCNPPNPQIDIEKATNGEDADAPTGPVVAVGDPISWTYVVTNTGNVPLTNVVVVDDQGVAVSCPKSELAPGESMICTAAGFAVAGQYANIGSVTGTPPAGPPVDDSDPSHYLALECGLEVTKTCQITPVPQDFDCGDAKPLDVVGMIWNGGQTIRVRAWKGDVGSTLLADIDPVVQGQEITVSGFAGSPNDVTWEIFVTGTSSKIGESVFHLSCSDDDMNGPEDCGLPQGDGKSNDAGLINDWQLDTLSGNGLTLDCTPTPPLPAEECFALAPLASCDTVGTPDTLTWKYTGGGCAASDNSQEPGKSTCVESSPGIDGGQPVTVTDDDGNVFVLAPDDEFTTVRDASKMLYLTQPGRFEDHEIHVSCSQPLIAGESYGSLTLVGLDGQRGDVEVEYAYTVTNNGPPVFGINLVDTPLGPVAGPFDLGTGESQSFSLTVGLMETTTNVADAQGTLAGGPICAASDEVTVNLTEPCDECKGGTTDITFRYLGSDAAEVVLYDKSDADPTKILFEGLVFPGQLLSITARPGQSKLNNDVSIYVDGQFHAKAHTSCSQPIGPGIQYGDFLITEARSVDNGLMCPLNSCEVGEVPGSMDCNGICGPADQAGSADCDGFCEMGDSFFSVDCDGVCDPGDGLDSVDCDGACDVGDGPGSVDCDGVCDPADAAGSDDCVDICVP